jgi:hypothetical protein
MLPQSSSELHSARPTDNNVISLGYAGSEPRYSANVQYYMSSGTWALMGNGDGGTGEAFSAVLKALQPVIEPLVTPAFGRPARPHRRQPRYRKPAEPTVPNCVGCVCGHRGYLLQEMSLWFARRLMPIKIGNGADEPAALPTAIA